jgi:hypothetical protein
MSRIPNTAEHAKLCFLFYLLFPHLTLKVDKYRIAGVLLLQGKKGIHNNKEYS